jgi:ribonucleoside-diphosphate reductase alpha chain
LEEPLPAGGSCLLGSINLNAFVDKENKTFNFNDFKNTVKISVKALNDVLDEGLPLHPLKEQRDSVRDWRQIGLGVMGISDMLINLGITYGSKESIELCDKIAYTMANTAIKASAKLAKEYGSFPKCEINDIITTKFFIDNTDEKTRDLVLEYGLRNSQLLTIAPTGSISTMLQISGGIEPIFANYYTRKTESLHNETTYYKVYTPIVKNYMDEHNISDDTGLPEFFITSQELPYRSRIEMQSVWQKHIDASISSTVNLPVETTVEDVYNLYLYAWEKGLKGITIYRDGCKRSGVLITEDTKKDNDSSSNEIDVQLQRGDIIEISDDLIGKKRKLITGCGSLHCVAFFDPITGDLMETYFSKGSAGGCNNFMIGLSRAISLLARTGCDIHSIIEQLNSTGSCPSYAVRHAVKKDTSKGSCCPMAIGNALLDMYNEIQDELGFNDKSNETNLTNANEDDNKPKCPQCNENLTFEGGCNICKSCGWSKCD